MSSKLATALLTVIEEKGLAGNLGKVAEMIGISYPSLKGVLSSKGKPNKATAAKYRSFLGIDEEDFAGLLADAPRGGKPPKVTGGKRGRPRKNAEVTFTASNSVPNDEPEVLSLAHPMAGVAQVTTKHAPRATASQASSSDLDRALAAMQGFLDDELVLKVHAASPAIRSLIAKILG
jgi:hypothetical protein